VVNRPPLSPRAAFALRTAAFLAVASWLLVRVGATSWALDHASLLALPALRARLAPLPAPFYTWDAVLYAALGALALFAVARLIAVLARTARSVASILRRGRPALGEAGQAMTEFAISFPVVLITTLILVQLALMYQAKNVVTYAAFAAARAAIVWIPAEAEGEGKHEINIDGGDKIDKIHQAAAMACVPIAPRASVVLDGMPFIGDVISQIFGAMSSMLGSFGPAGQYVENGLQRYAMSTFQTEVTLYKATVDGMEEQSGTASWDWPTDADLGVEVRHRYYLPIPVVNRFIGDPWSLMSLPPFFSIDLPGRYTFIRAVAVLPLEGETGNPPITGFWD
jgi:hypothetical protein